MQKLCKIGFPEKEHIPALKKLWADVFGDDEKVIDSFFENTFSVSKTVCAFYDNEPISVLYAIESAIFYQEKEYSAYYIYAVCTHPDYRGKGLMKHTFAFLEEIAKGRFISYFYLVPAEKSLFNLYGSLGFETAFSYTEAEVKAPEQVTESDFTLGVDYGLYKGLRLEEQKNPIVVLGELGFDSFVPGQPLGGVFTISVGDKGYAVLEQQTDRLVAQELFGDEAAVLNGVFAYTKAEKIILRRPAEKGGIPLGMLKSIDGSPILENGFIGSYGG